LAWATLLEAEALYSIALGIKSTQAPSLRQGSGQEGAHIKLPNSLHHSLDFKSFRADNAISKP